MSASVGTSTRLPPGPRWPAVLQTFALLRFRHRFVPHLHRRYGDVFTVRVLPSRAPLVLFVRPEHVREIFAGDPEVFHAGEANAALAPIMGRHSLLLQDSLDHRRARSLLTPAFNGDSLRGYAALIADLARREVAGWPAGVPFRSLDRMNALTLEVILHVVFGVTEEDRLARLRPLVGRVVDLSPVVLVGLAFPSLRRIGPWRAFVAQRRALDEVLFAEIARRRAEGDRGEDPGRTDVLSRLLAAGEPGDGLTDVELRDQLVTLLLAGHETTASALAWTLHELGRDAEQLAAAQAAADRGEDDHLEAVLKESMRLHPVIAMVVRRLTEPTTVGGVDLPRGAGVGPSILLAHADQEQHRDPTVFRPQRFADGEVSSHTWIPFGGGVRRCLGAGFSLVEGVAVLREVLRGLDVAVPDGAAEAARVRNVTSVPQHGARIVVRPRRAGSGPGPR